MTLKEKCHESSLRRWVTKIRAEGDCWIWTGGTTKGYAAFTFGDWNAPEEQYGHRASYRMFKGPIPKGMLVMHACDTPLCVNPSHLALGTIKENNDDSRRKGRATVGTKSHLAKVNEDDVREIRRRRAAGERLKAIGADYGLSEAGVCVIALRRKWKHIQDVEAALK